MANLHIKLDDFLMNRLKRTAKENNKNVSDYVRDLIAEDSKKSEDLPHEQLKELLVVSTQKQLEELSIMHTDLKVIFKQLLEATTTVKKSYSVQLANAARIEGFAEKTLYPVFPEIAKEALQIRNKIEGGN